MVDKKLAKEVRKMYERSKIKEDPQNILKFLEITKQLAVEDEELKEVLETEKITGQWVLTDRDFAWWLSAGDGVFDYGLGEADDPSFTMKANWDLMGGILSMEVDGTEAFMAGDLVIEGDLQVVTEIYGEITRVAIEAMQRFS